MKKNVRKRKKKKINRYIPILASGLLIALTVLVISWVFSARRTYTVVILKEGAEQEYAQYHSLAQAKEEMLTQTKRAEKQNAGIRYDHKLIAIGYGVVQFQRKDCTLNTSYRMAETEETGYTNGCYGNDAPLSISVTTETKYGFVRQEWMAGQLSMKSPYIIIMTKMMWRPSITILQHLIC